MLEGRESSSCDGRFALSNVVETEEPIVPIVELYPFQSTRLFLVLNIFLGHGIQIIVPKPEMVFGSNACICLRSWEYS